MLGRTLRWGGAWAVLGLVVGVALMFGKAEVIAESGRKPTELGFYAFWIPLSLSVASVFGLLLGLVFACLMEATNLLLKAIEAKSGVLTTYGQRLLCGTAAGGLIGWPVTRDRNALIAAGLGLGSAVVSIVINAVQAKRRKSELGRATQQS